MKHRCPSPALPTALLALAITACASTPSTNSPGGGSPKQASPGGNDSPLGGNPKGGAMGTGGTTGTAGAGSLPTRVLLEPGKTMACEKVPLAVATQHIEAECAVGPTKGACKGTVASQQGVSLENAGATVGFIETGDWMSYSDIAMDGITTLTFHYAKATDGGKIEARLDSATGTLLGTFTPTQTGAWGTWSDGTMAVTPSTGTHTLFLVATNSSAGIMNLDWIELSGGETSSGILFHLNQIGFDTLGPKHAVLEGPTGLKRFNVVGTDGNSLWCGDLVAESFSDWGSAKTFYQADFTGLTKPGTYKVQVDTSASTTFIVGDKFLLSTTLPAVLGYFKASRADDDDVWTADASIPISGTDKRVDARGGWYDASGDISKYLTHLSYANFLNPQQIPLVAWALAFTRDRVGTGSTSADALQAEALWGADYLLRVLAPEGFFYTTVFDHWSGNMGARQICAFSGKDGAENANYQSALREGGGMSIAALAAIAHMKVNGAFASADYLAGAEKAFAFLNTNGKQYADDGKENIIDDYTGLLAASELLATTKSATYLEAARARATSLLARLSADGYFIADGGSRPFWHASDAGLPIVALWRYLQLETDATRQSATKQGLQQHLDYLLRVTRAVANPYGYARQHTSANAASFFIPHENESGYWWQGENARLGSLAAAAFLGADAVGASSGAYLDLIRFAGTQVDWILGANPFDLCFLHGSGNKNPPKYCGDKQQNGTLAGGIANGITGKNPDGSGIQWAPGPCGDDWRWVEQWLPHASWYLVAVAAMAR